jgi:hypothetical protein
MVAQAPPAPPAPPMPAAPPASNAVLWVAVGLTAAAVLIIPINTAVLFTSTGRDVPTPFYLLAMLQALAGLGGLVTGIVHAVRARRLQGGRAGFVGAIVSAVLAALAMIGAPVGVVLAWGLSALASAGGAWGRPLRVRGRVLHPGLRAGSDWTQGDRPRTDDLDRATRAALEALWLHDAQKEHASVPAFSRISWMLAAVGAPADLVAWSHRAALEEVDHARRCFALAAGYGGRSHDVEPMPDLLVGRGLGVAGNPLVTLAIESLEDGCLLEDFNADVARACELACEDPATRDVLGRIAREERSHADFSWALLAWLVKRGGAPIVAALEARVGRLARVRRPTAVSGKNAALVARADAARMRAHGRIADAEWAALWEMRLVETAQRVRSAVRGEPRRVLRGAAHRGASAPTLNRPSARA